MLLQQLNLKEGEKATCLAGYPHLTKVVVEAKKDFSTGSFTQIIDNSYDFIKVVDSGRFGLLTSHLISGNWAIVENQSNA